MNPPWQDVVVRTPPVTVAAGSLGYASLPTVGNSLQLNNDAADTNVWVLPGAVTSGTVYYSMLLQFPTTSFGPSPSQSFFAGFDDHAPTSGTFSSGAGLVSMLHAVDEEHPDPAIALGIAAADNNNGKKKYSPDAYGPTDTLFVVGSYTFNPEAGDDVANLYVFLNGAPVPLTEPAEPTATTTGADLGAAGVRRFYIRDNIGEPDNINVDEVRIGTSWADILPLAGDARLDGKLNFDDYAMIDRGYARYLGGAIPAGTATWFDGDFNQDGAVDLADYAIIDQSFAASGSSGGGAAAAELTVVPEPGGCAVLLGMAAAAIRRRSRSR